MWGTEQRFTLFPAPTPPLPRGHTPHRVWLYRFSMKVLGYNLMQAMRFAVEEINNCSSLLPGVLLGYEMVDVCYLSNNIQPALYFLAQDDDFLPILKDYSQYRPHVVAIIGPDNSESAITVSNLLSYFLIPQVMPGRVRGARALREGNSSSLSGMMGTCAGAQA